MTEGTALAHRDEGGIEAVPDRFSQTIQMVREAMLNPAVDADKARAMADLMISLEERSLKAEFNRDLNAAITEMPVITKGGIIVIPAKEGRQARTQGRFARFEDIDRVVRPILQRNNLAIRFEVDESARGVVSVRPILSHANGCTERGGAMHLPIDDSGAKNKVQGVGSAVQYGKRYTMCALLNIVTEGTDDDGSLGKGVIVMPHERAEAVLKDAEAAATEGRYGEFFSSQGVKDRAWLVAEGHHERLGGPALPAPSGARPSPPPPPPPSSPPPPPPPASTQTSTAGGDKKKTTPREWVDRLKGEITRCRTTEFLDEYLDGKREALDRLKVSDPNLHEEVIEASRYQRDAIEEGRLV